MHFFLNSLKDKFDKQISKLSTTLLNCVYLRHPTSLLHGYISDAHRFLSGAQFERPYFRVSQIIDNGWSIG